MEETPKPTKEQLIKAFELFYTIDLKEEIIGKDSDLSSIAEQILNKWNG